jgi:threonine dehydratase
MKVTLEDIRKAQSTIADVAFKTAMNLSRSCSDLVGKKVYLKFENQQLTGSFKVRGALNKIASLTQDEKKKGVIAASAGNHAQGVALAATRLNVKSFVVMPKSAPIVKVEATRSYGAEVILHGDSYDEAYTHAQELQSKHGYVFVHPFADPLIIAGQGTIGLEIVSDLPEVDTVICPIGGGGLISGIATAVKAHNPNIKIFGVQSRAANSMIRSFREGVLVEQKERVITIADGVAVKKPNAEILNDFLKPMLSDVTDITEDEIAESLVFLMERAKTIVEGSGALSLAALKKLKHEIGQHVVLILSGGNIDLNTLEKVVHRGLIKSGRLAELRVAVEDRPGVLRQLTTVFAENGCNILEVRHDRNQMGIELGGTSIDIVVETTGAEHAEKVRQILLNKGFRLV